MPFINFPRKCSFQTTKDNWSICAAVLSIYGFCTALCLPIPLSLPTALTSFYSFLLFSPPLVWKIIGFSSRQSHREIYLHHLNLNRLVWLLIMVVKWYVSVHGNGNLNKYACFFLALITIITMGMKPNYP